MVLLLRGSSKSHRSFLNSLDGRLRELRVDFDTDRAAVQRPSDRRTRAAAQEGIEHEIAFVRRGTNHSLQIPLGKLIGMAWPALLVVALHTTPALFAVSAPDVQ